MKINGYRLDEQIKETEFVTVYRATQIALDRLALLKVIKAQFASETNAMERLRREALAVAKISHPNVIHVYDFGEENGNVFVAMEFFPSQDFQKVLQDRKQLPLDLCISALRQSLEGLSAAHKQGIFHRDIKPANLLLGDDNLVKITDFGLANLASATGVTVEGSIIGTPRYMSPEQISGAKPSSQSEIFSLGVTFYEILTGISPFDADSYSAVFNKILNYIPESVQTLRPEIPDELSVIIQQMIAKNPDERFPDCKAVLDALDPVSIRDSATEKSRENLQGVKPSVSGNRRSMIYLFGLLMLVIIAAIVIYNLFNRPPTEMTLTQPEGFQEVVPVTDSLTDSTKIQTHTQPTVQNQDTNQKEVVKKPSVEPPVENLRVASNDTIVSDDVKPSLMMPSKLWIGVLPWASVTVDGDSIGTTPLHNPIQLAPGEHQVELRHPDYPLVEKTVRLKPGITDSLRIDLAKQSGYLSLAVYPWAALYIDGKFVDNTPIPKPVILAPGRHLVQLKHPDYQDWQKYVDVAAGDTISLKITL